MKSQKALLRIPTVALSTSGYGSELNPSQQPLLPQSLCSPANIICDKYNKCVVFVNHSYSHLDYAHTHRQPHLCAAVNCCLLIFIIRSCFCKALALSCHLIACKILIVCCYLINKLTAWNDFHNTVSSCLDELVIV